MTSLPPPTLEEHAAREQWRTGGVPPKRDKAKVFAAVAVVAAVGWVGYTVVTNPNRNDDSPSRLMTLSEVACDLLNDGRPRELAYGVLKDLAEDHPLTYGEDESIAARAALDRAEDQGCG